MDIDYTFPNSEEKLAEAYQFIQDQLNPNSNYPRSLKFYQNVYNSHPSLLMTAQIQSNIIGCAFGSKNQFNPGVTDEILIGEVCVHPNYQHQQVGFTLLFHLENNVKQLGFRKLILGARAGAEGFYFKCGFLANLHIQVEDESCLDGLKKVNTGYPIIEEEVKEGWTRLLLKTQDLDPQLEKSYLKAYPMAYLQYAFTKEL